MSIGRTMATARMLSAIGRDRRTDLEKSLRAEIEKLQHRVEQLEARPSVKYAGTWKEKNFFGEGVLVTDNGSMWHAKRPSIGERPGQTDAWTLAVKRGRDGRDAVVVLVRFERVVRACQGAYQLLGIEFSAQAEDGGQPSRI
jgi:hypothetical protein